MNQKWAKKVAFEKKDHATSLETSFICEACNTLWFVFRKSGSFCRSNGWIWMQLKPGWRKPGCLMPEQQWVHTHTHTPTHHYQRWTVIFASWWLQSSCSSFCQSVSLCLCLHTSHDWHSYTTWGCLFLFLFLISCDLQWITWAAMGSLDFLFSGQVVSLDAVRVLFSLCWLFLCHICVITQMSLKEHQWFEWVHIQWVLFTHHFWGYCIYSPHVCHDHSDATDCRLWWGVTYWSKKPKM